MAALIDAGYLTASDTTARPYDEVFHEAVAALTETARLLRVAFDDDDGVIGGDDDPMMGTAPLGVVSGAVVGVLTALPSG